LIDARRAEAHDRPALAVDAVRVLVGARILNQRRELRVGGSAAIARDAHEQPRERGLLRRGALIGSGGIRRHGDDVEVLESSSVRSGAEQKRHDQRSQRSSADAMQRRKSLCHPFPPAILRGGLL
jgi:hypothetical protein